jgi:hypothetical protein
VQTEWFVGTIAVHNVTTGRQDEGVNVTEGTVAVPGVACPRRAWILRDAQARLHPRGGARRRMPAASVDPA